jgi:two-component system phosphate regulon sensor histidine kinase PhoR
LSLGFRLRLFAVSALVVYLACVLADEIATGTLARPWFAFAIGAALAAFAITWLGSRWFGTELRAVTESARALEASHSEAIGELRAERDLIAGILDGMQEGVLMIDADGRVARVNPTLRDILLLSNDVVGRAVFSVIRHAALMELVELARDKGIAKSTEIELGGLKPRRLLVRVVPLESGEGALLVVFVDVTDLRRLEVMRRDFVANVSHELRTPVTAVQSATETLLAGAVSEQEAAKKFLGIIERNTERLRSLIDDLLDLSRIEAKEFKLRREPTDLTTAIQSVFATAKERAEKQRVELALEVDPAARTAFLDRRAIEQVMGNLVENAVKYCPGARIVVTAKPRSGSGVTIAIADTGPGIEQRHLGRIFERFYRVDPGRSRELGGTGLGLSIVKHLVEALGGTVSVTSAVGKGTTFTVELPKVEDSAPRLPADESPRARSPSIP